MSHVFNNKTIFKATQPKLFCCGSYTLLSLPQISLVKIQNVLASKHIDFEQCFLPNVIQW
jgi:hypothetical protein